MIPLYHIVILSRCFERSAMAFTYDNHHLVCHCYRCLLPEDVVIDNTNFFYMKKYAACKLYLLRGIIIIIYLYCRRTVHIHIGKNC